MSLAKVQQTFMTSILDAEADLPASWGNRHAAGMQIYRGNYRNALVEALRDTFIKTERWAGEAPFKQAAINHVIAHPSASWTIDDAGVGFDETCARFFSNAPEVAELAWLEWAMLGAFSVCDTQPITPEQFANLSSGFGEEEWINLRLEFVPDLSCRMAEHDLHAMWMAADGAERPDLALEEPRGVLVWREGERATFQMVEPDEVRALKAALSGQAYGEICIMLAGDDPTPEQVQAAAMRAGAILGRWVQEGFVLALEP